MTHHWCLFPALGGMLIRSAMADAAMAVPDTEKDTSIPRMEATEAAATWKLPPGCRATVVAAEPVVRNPIALSWDDRGRLWIAENFTYAEPAVRFDLSLHDRVLVFPRQPDGSPAAVPKVFTDRVQRLTSVLPGPGGVWLMCPPQLLFIPDADGDDVPDGPPVPMLDGFTVAAGNYHNFANGLRWGPDGWLYGRCGHSCPGNLGVPGCADDARVPMEGGIWRFHPQRHTVEVVAHGTTNPWGHDWDARGELFFINTVNGHLWHMIPGAHFRESFGADPNPLVFHRLEMHADHWHFDTGKGWQKSRDGSASDLGGGHAHVGMMIAQGTSWPESCDGRLLTFNLHGRRLNVERLDRHGSGFVARHEPDIAHAADPWFRGMDLSTGPDGHVYVIDWSDTGECHDHSGVHRSSGRIYRITGPRESADTDVIRGSAMNPDALRRTLRHPNPWHFRQFLAWKESRPDRIPVLTELLDRREPEVVRLRALWALHSEGGTNVANLLPLLADQSESMRVWALRLLSDTWPIDDATGRPRADQPTPEPVRLALLDLAKHDASAMARLAIASLLQRLPIPERPALAAILMSHAGDAADHNLPAMLWCALTPLVSRHPDALAAMAAGPLWAPVAEWMSRALLLQSERSPLALATFLELASRADAAVRRAIVTGLREASHGWHRSPAPASWKEFAATFTDDPFMVPPLQHLGALFGSGVSLEELSTVARDRSRGNTARRAAFASLLTMAPPSLAQTAAELLGDRAVDDLAVRALAQAYGDAAAVPLLTAFSRFSPAAQAAAVDALASREASAASLIDALAARRLPRKAVSAFHARQILKFGNPQLSRGLEAAWGRLRESPDDRRRTAAALTDSLTPDRLRTAQLPRGRQLFQSLCASCHRLYGEGGSAGPDLTGSGRQRLDYLIPNLVDPAAEVAADFQLRIVRLKDGSLLSGIPAARTDRTLTLRGLTGETVVALADLASEETSDDSLMPAGLLESLAPDEVRDLMGYLMHPEQVPLPD
jgi:putative membrane-bound dehydrogenase-like protein